MAVCGRQLGELAEAARTVRLDEDGVPIGLRELFPKAHVKHVKRALPPFSRGYIGQLL